jgi:hypothetical protein
MGTRSIRSPLVIIEDFIKKKFHHNLVVQTQLEFGTNHQFVRMLSFDITHIHYLQ